VVEEPVYVARFERGVRPIGRWSTRTSRRSRSKPSTTRPPTHAAVRRLVRVALRPPRVGRVAEGAATSSTSALADEARLARARHAGDGVKAPSGKRTSSVQVFARTPASSQPAGGVRGARARGAAREQCRAVATPRTARAPRAGRCRARARRAAPPHRPTSHDQSAWRINVELVLDDEQRVADAFEPI
jgi:hypothetical protein